MLGAEDVKACDIVAHRDRDDTRNVPMFAPAGDLGQRDVAGREIDLIDAGENQLQRTSLGSNDQVEAAGVA
jgi:hypothetical protein